MRHRTGSSKIKYEHGMIDGLRKFLKGLKCFAQSGHSIQEVFIVSSKPKVLQERIKNLFDK